MRVDQQLNDIGSPFARGGEPVIGVCSRVDRAGICCWPINVLRTTRGQKCGYRCHGCVSNYSPRSRETSHAFEAFSRRHGDFAIAACAVTAVLAGDRFASLRIGVGGVADVPLVLDGLAAGFVGETADTPSVRRIAQAVADAVEVHDQPGISAAYRRDLVKALLARALQRITAGVTQPD